MLRLFASFIPGPAIIFVTEWLNLYTHTVLVYPEWQKSAEAVSLGLGVIVAVVIGVAKKGAQWSELRAWTISLFWFTLAGIITCLIIWFVLGRSFSTEIASLLQDCWFIVFIATMAFMSATITVAALALSESKPNIFRWIVAGLMIVVLLIVGFIVWKIV
ncbi:MAG: hypothetical protein WC670_12540 [Pseudolabrys sp.]|jgi:hypothetical protein